VRPTRPFFEKFPFAGDSFQGRDALLRFLAIPVHGTFPGMDSSHELDKIFKARSLLILKSRCRRIRPQKQARGTKSVTTTLQPAVHRARGYDNLFHPLNHLTVERFLDNDVRHGDRSFGAGRAGGECDFAFQTIGLSSFLFQQAG